MATAYTPTEYGTLEANAPDEVSISVTGYGAPSSAGVPSVETAGALLPPEAAPPSVPEGVLPVPGPTQVPGEEGPPAETGPLTDAWEPVQRSLLETYAAQQQRADQLAEEQRAANERARAQLEYGYQRYADAGQEAMDLAEQQRLARPPLKAPPVEPAVPQQRFEPFGTGPEKETGMQALNRITMTLGLLAQMGMGMKSGYTRGAMASFSGALEGWAQGQKIKGDQEWREYLANVQKMDREWARERQYQDDILKRDAVDLDRAKLKMAIRQTELGYSKELVNLTLRDADQRLKMFDIERDMLQNLMKNSMTVMSQRLLADFRNRQQTEIENYHRQQILAQNLNRELQAARDRATAAYQQGQLGGSAAQRAETARHNLAMEAIGNRRIDEQQVKVGAVQQQLNAAVSQSGAAVESIQRMLANPEQKKVVEQYLGPVEQYRLGYERNAPWRGELPKEAVALEQELSTIQANLKFLLAGKTMTGIEAASVMGMLPQLSDRPDAFAQKLEGTKRNIALLEKKPNKIEGQRVINVQGPDGRVRPYALDPGETGPPAGYKVVP